VNRRQFVKIGVAAGVTVATASCGSSVTGPIAASTVPLLTRLKQLGHTSAKTVQYKNTNAYMIEIGGTVNKTFKVGNVLLGEGPVVSPTLDMARFEVPIDAEVIVS